LGFATFLQQTSFNTPDKVMRKT